jgi:hypothetical protein
MRTPNEFDTEREDELFSIENNASHTTTDNKKVKPHIIRRNVEDYLERKALQKRLKDVFEED